MAGAYFGGRCYSSQSEASDAYFGGLPLAISNGASFRFEKQGITWVVQRYTLESNGAWTYSGQSLAPVTLFPSCDPAEPFLDGVAIGWGIAAAMVMAAIYKNMRRAAA